MTRAVCARCGVGSLPGVDSSLRRAEAKRKGFRSTGVMVHKNQHLCVYVMNERGKFLAKQEAEAARQRVWWRRLVRRLHR